MTARLRAWLERHAEGSIDSPQPEDARALLRELDAATAVVEAYRALSLFKCRLHTCGVADVKRAREIALARLDAYDQMRRESE